MSQLDSERINLIREVYRSTGSIKRTAEITGHSTITVNRYVNETSSQKPNSRYSIRPVLKIDPATNETMEEYKNLSVAAKENDLSVSTVCHAIRRIGTAGGFLWMYEDKKREG